MTTPAPPPPLSLPWAENGWSPFALRDAAPTLRAECGSPTFDSRCHPDLALGRARKLANLRFDGQRCPGLTVRRHSGLTLFASQRGLRRRPSGASFALRRAFARPSFSCHGLSPGCGFAWLPARPRRHPPVKWEPREMVGERGSNPRLCIATHALQRSTAPRYEGGCREGPRVWAAARGLEGSGTPGLPTIVYLASDEIRMKTTRGHERPGPAQARHLGPRVRLPTRRSRTAPPPLLSGGPADYSTLPDGLHQGCTKRPAASGTCTLKDSSCGLTVVGGVHSHPRGTDPRAFAESTAAITLLSASRSRDQGGMGLVSRWEWAYVAQPLIDGQSALRTPYSRPADRRHQECVERAIEVRASRAGHLRAA